MPADCWRSLRNASDVETVVMLMTAGDGRKHIIWASDVVLAAAQLGKALDADGYVAPKYFVDRAQP
jgi:hypothetical protein